ncbi:LOW QUALITY PROTEIN: hypothetical protein TorRG33x02_181400 [Trema orientale]|uniref:Uncharacterized protein n=1 Tax=Trema orientale TaxID=63057 RepID=A0A2P5EKM6_TREOI|nr:LOW QUALITY PROTEIN: hypothetical protein TorRG33x02_181400 [Trema orientale]
MFLIDDLHQPFKFPSKTSNSSYLTALKPSLIFVPLPPPPLLPPLTLTLTVTPIWTQNSEVEPRKRLLICPIMRLEILRRSLWIEEKGRPGKARMGKV